MLEIVVGDVIFRARLEREIAPMTCQAFERLLPFGRQLIQARWSGEAGWIPLGELDIGVGKENPITNPDPGQVLFYPAGISQTEILFPYGVSRFACQHGPLEGNHFLTVVAGGGRLAEIGRRIQWEGAQDVVFRMAESQ
jgi:hypothetical protein